MTHNTTPRFHPSQLVGRLTPDSPAAARCSPRRWGALFAVLLLLAGAACQSKTEPAPTGTKTEAAPATKAGETEASPATPQPSADAVEPTAPNEPSGAGDTESNEAAGEVPADSDGQDTAAAPADAEAPPAGGLDVSGTGPLSEEARAVFWGSAEDPPTEHLDAIKVENEGKHFLFSDEYHPQLFEPHIKNLGGGYVGIGTDQAYLYIGWQRPILAWTADYDPWVVWMHMAYQAFFLEATTPDEFIALFESKNKGLEVLERRYSEHAKKTEILYVYEEGQHKTKWRLLRMRNALRKEGVRSFLDDQEIYDFVRTLVQNGRVRPLLGNLLDANGFVGIGDTANKLGVPIRVLYLSNAEQYWDYTDQYRTNMLSLPYPTDGKGWVLRALATKPQNDDYRYVLQTPGSWQAYLRKGTTNVRRMVPRIEIEGRDHFPLTIMEDEPAAGKPGNE